MALPAGVEAARALTSDRTGGRKKSSPPPGTVMTAGGGMPAAGSWWSRLTFRTLGKPPAPTAVMGSPRLLGVEFWIDRAVSAAPS
jgi:hypothetical protein